ncbi:class I SAM-dependent methyltransferase [Brachybacterium phenoliresistens]|uniref:class I SAM-dependent methyltransferase n=1 Tax=Brachybacterium phenoliresistens TaxID=396014 RepID=UPI0031E39779
MPSTPPPDAYYADPRLAACYDTIDGSREDLDHYRAIAEELGARTVVDLGCGTGSFAVLLASAGYQVIGVDPAAASLDLARAKERALPPGAAPITWVEGDATAIGPLGADLAVMTGNVAQVFTTDESWETTLRGLRAALRRGGHLVFESRRPAARAWERWQAEDREQRHEVPGIGTVLTRPRGITVDLPRVTFTDEFVLPDGTALTSTSTLRFRDEAELRSSVAAAGFEVLEVREAPDRPGLEHVVLARAV